MKNDEKIKLISIQGGGDWIDASVDNLAVPANVNVDFEFKQWEEYDRSRREVGNDYISFCDWMKRLGAVNATEEQLPVYWEGP